MNSDEMTKNLTEDLTPAAPDTAPLLRELLRDFREECAANQQFRTEALQRLDALEQGQQRMILELKAIRSTQRFRYSRLDDLAEEVESLKVA
jgi:hypothetical protein